MDGSRISRRPRTAALILVMLAVVVSWPGLARANEASLRTVALMSYHQVGEELVPSRTFSGVVLNGRYIVTSRWALEQGHANPFAGYQAELAVVLGVVRDGDTDQMMQIELTPWDPPRMSSNELALLEVPADQREDLAELVRRLPELGTLEGMSPARLLGVPTPLGLERVTHRTVPLPLELSIAWEESLRSRGTLAVPRGATFPPQLVGSGVWSSEQDLLGVLVREDDGWWVVDASVVKELGELAGLDWESPELVQAADPGAELRRPEPRPRSEVRGIYELLDRNGLQMMLDRNMVDWAGQPQADLIMAMIAGGEYERALGLLDRIEPLVTGRLAEQMTYRRALTLTLTGDYEDARELLANVDTMDDELSRARGRLLRDVLEAREAGQLEGLDLSEPQELADACLMTLAEVEADFAEELEEVRSRVDSAPVELVLVQLEGLAQKVRAYRLAWPGYFGPMTEQIDDLRDELVPPTNR